MSGEQLKQVNGVELALQTFGRSGDPAVLLIGSGTTGMLTWADDLCADLAAAGRYVVRYDVRDTGRSVTYETGKPEYDLRVLAADAAGLLDALGLDRAHVVGFSVGGWIAQLLALDHADRVASLTLISTRAIAHGRCDPDLPDHSPELMAHFRSVNPPDWSDRDAVLDHLVGAERVFAGSHLYDGRARRDVLARVVDRGANLASSTVNISFTDPGPRWRERLGGVRVPTLVLHGTEDPFFPYGNGEVLAAEIPGARLLSLEGTGHELAPADRPRLVAAILDQSARDGSVPPQAGPGRRRRSAI